MTECHEEVTRNGVLEPCEREAVAMRLDPTEGTPYPVCIKHTRGPGMIPVHDFRDALHRINMLTGRPVFGKETEPDVLYVRNADLIKILDSP